MGRVPTEPPAAAAPPPPSSTPITHFTHPHDLHPTPLFNPQTPCTGCKLPSTGTMYTCLPCNFTLHQTCAVLPSLITHPSHGGCTLSLLTAASYPGGVFSCDACSRRGDGWSYHCGRCEYDLHVTCASKQLKIRHVSHSTCDLDLTFKNPYVNATGFSCDICRKIGSKQWLYRCGTCEFDVHVDCATAAPPQLQHHHSLPPAVNNYNNNQLVHSASFGGGGQQVNGYAVGQIQQPGPVNNAGRVHGSVPGQQQQVIYQSPRVNSVGSNLMMSAMSGLVEGAFQGLGQAAVQEIIGGGGDCGDGGGNQDGSSY